MTSGAVYRTIARMKARGEGNGRSRIQMARELRGWSQKELAQRAKVSPSFVSSIERGEYTPTVTVARKLAGALGFSLDELWPDVKEATR